MCWRIDSHDIYMIANYSANIITDVAIFYFLSKIGFTALIKNSKLIQRFEHKHGNGLKTLTSQTHPIVRNLHETQIETGKKKSDIFSFCNILC